MLFQLRLGKAGYKIKNKANSNKRSVEDNTRLLSSNMVLIGTLFSFLGGCIVKPGETFFSQNMGR